MTNAMHFDDARPNPVELHPIDQERLQLQGKLPDLPLLVHPQLLADLAKPPSSLDNIETTCRNLPLDVERPDEGISLPDPDPHDPRQDYTYRGYLLRPRMDAYVRAMEIYSHVDASYTGKLSTRLRNCRTNAWFVQHKKTREIKVASSRCKLRWCPICRDVSRHIVTIAVEKWLRSAAYPKMLTFTLKHSDDPLQLQIKTLYKSFQKVRRRSIMANAATGGIWFFQLKFNHTTEQWHPHIHCLVAGGYIPHKRLKEIWHAITGDSFIVDIRPVQDIDSASSEVARYATSPCDMSAINRESAIDVYHATKHQRICGSWGNARGTTLAPQPQPDKDDWQHVADFYYVSIHRNHIQHLKEFWNCYKTGKPYTGPPPQDERDLFKDELDLHFNPLAKVLDPRLRFLKIVEDKSTNFFPEPPPKEQS